MIRTGDQVEPALTVLQLDTIFPRIKGDVACPETYRLPIEIKKIDHASVAKVVTARPDETDIKGFQDAAAAITTGIGTTSCGFLSYWQDHLARSCPQPFIASALVDLPVICQNYTSQEMALLTFDEDALKTPLYEKSLSGFDGQILGLASDMHLRDVIANDRPDLDPAHAEQEIIDLLRAKLNPAKTKALILECTNLPPYKAAIKAVFDLEVYDILTSLHLRNPDLVKPEFLP